MNVRYVGLDVHKRQIVACFLDETGAVLKRHSFPADALGLQEFARDHLQPQDRLALEATTNSWAVVRALQHFVAEVAVGNPLKIKHIAEAHVKTDKIDAETLAQLLRCNYFPRVWQPAPAVSQLRELTGRRTALVGQRTAVRNRIHATLAMRLLCYDKRDLFSRAGLAWLAEMPLDAEARLLVNIDLQLHAAIQTQLDALEQELARRGHEQRNVKLLMTLPGVDSATAQALLAAWGEVDRFRDADRAVSYLGLVPKTRASAERCHHGSITKAGNSQARHMLVQAAQSAARHPGPLGHFFKKLLKRKSRNVAIVALARKLAAIAWRMLMHQEPYRYAIPKTTEQKLARLRVKATGAKRQGGSGKGVKSTAKLPGGSRRLKPLSEVYAAEDLPSLSPPAAGELRALEESGAADFAASLQHARRVPRRAAPAQPSSQPAAAREHPPTKERAATTG